MKNFKNFISESGIGTAHQNQAIDNNTNMSALSNPEVMKKLNAWVGTIAGSYVLPEDAVSKLRSSLMKVGLTFGEVPMMEGESGTVELRLTLFGGRFGKEVDTPHDEFVNDDGLSHMIEGGLTLAIGYEMQEDNSCRLTAKIS